jgi:DNA polymerase
MSNARIIERGAESFLPADRSLPRLREAVQQCQGCELHKNATQAVLGEGPADARVMLVGEQPGDYEDKEGAPFVGPAGKVLDKALIDLGIVRGEVYLTNGVKHFRWSAKGKRRIHETPRASEIRACRPWLEAEIDAIEPELIVCLGSIAVQSLLGPKTKLLVNRGKIFETAYGPCLLTVHPSSILRVEETGDRQEAYDAFLSDLKRGLEFLSRARM